MSEEIMKYRPSVDIELEAIAEILMVLAPLTFRQRGNALEYVRRRVENEPLKNEPQSSQVPALSEHIRYPSMPETMLKQYDMGNTTDTINFQGQIPSWVNADVTRKG